jgi:hypothetical protein
MDISQIGLRAAEASLDEHLSGKCAMVLGKVRRMAGLPQGVLGRRFVGRFSEIASRCD